MDECIIRSDELPDTLWQVVRQGSIMKGRFLDWESYEDPDTLNFFYAKKLVDPIHGVSYPSYTWTTPLEVKTHKDRHFGLQYQRLIRSKLLRKLGPWEMLRCTLTGTEFYYDQQRDLIRYPVPREANWDVLLRNAIRVC